MFGYPRRKSHRQLAKAELSQGLGHLKQAANHTAGGIGATVGPRMQAARGYVAPAADRAKKTAAGGLLAASSALAPLAVATAGGARQAGSMARSATVRSRQVTGRAKNRVKPKRTSRRWPLMLAAGVAAGATAAAVLRRRREQQWDSYQPNLALDAARSGEVPEPTETRPATGPAKSATMSSGQSTMSTAQGPGGAAQSGASAAQGTLGSTTVASGEPARPAGANLSTAAGTAAEGAKPAVTRNGGKISEANTASRSNGRH